MRNPQFCQDAHAVRLVADDVSRHRDKSIQNTFDWNTDKDKKRFIPSDYPYEDFDYRFFWKKNDNFNYFNNIWVNGRVVPFVWKMSQPEASSNRDQKSIVSTNESSACFILWIDRMTDDNRRVVSQLSAEYNNVKVDFRDTLSEAQNYILQNVHNIRSSSTFQIICRGYYKHENKNPLNLLQFLDNHGLSHVSVIVFTEDKAGVEHHFQNQAPSMNIRDWEERITLTSTSESLVKRIKRNITGKR